MFDRIKYDSPGDDALVWKVPSEEIRLGAQLIVNESQEALFVKGGAILDSFTAGTHTLSTGNVPLLRRLVNLPFGGKTPFSAEVWYVNLTARRDLKWGTKAPIQVIDPVYNYPVSIRAFGRWGIRVKDARSFLAQVVGSQASAETSKVESYFTGHIVQRLSDQLTRFFTEQKVSAFQANAKLNELAAFTLGAISPEFDRFGIEVVNFDVERISIPDEDQARFQEILGKRMEIEQISGASVGQAYTTMRTFDTLEKAAENEGSGAGQFMGAGLGLGAGLGAGVPIGQQVGGAMNVQPQQPPAADDPMAKLQKIKEMLDGGLISQDDFDKKKAEILESL
ncbi:SPFH domain-containing protein [Planctomycetota bacterium]|nr:SPFH domain-containing protein [Planctomycetota bacterium]